jgi:hypothetical protein
MPPQANRGSREVPILRAMPPCPPRSRREGPAANTCILHTVPALRSPRHRARRGGRAQHSQTRSFPAQILPEPPTGRAMNGRPAQRTPRRHRAAGGQIETPPSPAACPTTSETGRPRPPPLPANQPVVRYSIPCASRPHPARFHPSAQASGHPDARPASFIPPHRAVTRTHGTALRGGIFRDTRRTIAPVTIPLFPTERGSNPVSVLKGFIRDDGTASAQVPAARNGPRHHGAIDRRGQPRRHYIHRSPNDAESVSLWCGSVCVSVVN